MGEEEHWAAEILSTDRNSESLLSCDYSLAFFCQKLPAGMKGKSFLHDLCWGLAASQALAKHNTRAGFEQSKARDDAGSHGGSKDVNWEIWLFPASASTAFLLAG